MRFTGTVRGTDKDGVYVDRIEADRDTRKAAENVLEDTLLPGEELVAVDNGSGDYDLGMTDG